MTKTPQGYYGVIIPKYNFYQGYFLYEDAVKLAEDLALLRGGGPLATTRRPVPGVRDEDQGLLGAISAALVEGARSQNMLALTRAANIVSALADTKYFVVRGEIDPKGIATTFERMPPEVNSPDAARDYIHSLPEVKLIQGALMKEAVELAHGEKKRQ